MWVSGGTQDEANHLRHCTSPEAYAYTWSEEYVYKPEGCQDVPLTSYATKTGVQSFFIATYTQETILWSAAEPDCRHTAEETCTSLGGRFSKSGGRCVCNRFDEYFVQNPEATIINFDHGYSLNYEDPFGAPLLESARRPFTAFYNDAGSECTFSDSRSKWSPESQKTGISVALHDLLSCAGLDLDAESDATRSHMDGETKAPTSRLTGASLELDFQYENMPVHRQLGFDEVLCKVIVKANPQWTSRPTLENIDIPSPFDSSARARSRYSYGIAIEAKGGGTMAAFHFTNLMSELVNWLVLLSLPDVVVSFIALHLIGLLSKVYKAAACEVLSIQEKVIGVCARLAAYEFSFRAMSEQMECSSGQLQKMSVQSMLETFQLLFRAEGHDHGLDDFELHHMAQYVVQKMDSDRNGLVSMYDFVTGCSRNEPMGLALLGSFFSANHSPSILEKAFSERKFFQEAEGVYRQDSLFDIKLKNESEAALEKASAALEEVREKGKQREAEIERAEEESREEFQRASGELQKVERADSDTSLLSRQISDLGAELEKLKSECRMQLERHAEQLLHLHGGEHGKSVAGSEVIENQVARLTEDLAELKGNFNALDGEVGGLSARSNRPLSQAEQRLPLGMGHVPPLALGGLTPRLGWSVHMPPRLLLGDAAAAPARGMQVQAPRPDRTFEL
eukprot:TRINITY_DN95347_c0_g1_i1.p1 TRINITY_DN95347_c0_g1~~TRINITY_DN95347_c0_g1_i1.p1  ORF type:complete len:768 (-),score=109.89 TRINITY_DN95347_c0_g1_i1:141-2180(-)